MTITLTEDEWQVGETKTLTCDLEFDTGTFEAASYSFILPGSGELDNVIWTSSDESVLTIDEGVAEFVGYGQSMITLNYDGRIDRYTVNVKMATESADDSDDYFLSSNDDFYDSFSSDGGTGYSDFPDIVYLSLIHI